MPWTVVSLSGVLVAPYSIFGNAGINRLAEKVSTSVVLDIRSPAPHLRVAIFMPIL
jgi:hypothetical protein